MLLALLACSENNLVKNNDEPHGDSASGAPDIEVDPKIGRAHV